MRALALSGVIAVALSACASGAPLETLAERRADLAQDCRERGGILVPSGGPLTGRPEVDNHCRITGGGSRLPGG